MRWLDEIGIYAASALEILGIVIVLLVALVATLRALIRFIRLDDRAEIFHQYRHALARGILIGLEPLVAADLIHSVVVALTIESVFALALIVLIRTFLSFSLEVEMEGRWPWQRDQAQGRSAA